MLKMLYVSPEVMANVVVVAAEVVEVTLMRRMRELIGWVRETFAA